MTSRRRIELMIATSWAMTVSTFQLFVVIVLAASLIDELGISRWQVGVLGAMNTGVGALVAPSLGGLADRLGSRRAMVALGAGSAVGFIGTAVAHNYWLLVAASGVAGLAQGAGNPVTNKVIAEEVPAEHQGAVTGVKQSGVQLAVFGAGITMPAAAATIGWRWALVILGVVTLLSSWAFWTRFGSSHATPVVTTGPVAAEGEPLAGFVYRVAIYALLLGLTAGGVTRFYPLFAQEVLGYSEAEAGLAVAATGLAAIVARLVWARLVPGIPPGAALVVLALGSAVATWALLATELLAAWLLWPTVLLVAFTIAAWNVVAMLAVIWSVPSRLSGRGTGVVLMGFLSGLTLSSPLAGLAIDWTGSYRSTWVALGALAVAGALAVGRSVPDPSRRPVTVSAARRE